MFTISGTSDIFWNKNNFIEYLAKHQRQQIEVDIVPEAVCLENLGAYKLLDMFEFESVTIKTWNPLETHPSYRIVSKGPNFWFDRTAVIDPELHQWDQTAVFLCLYHRPTAARLGLASYAQQYSSLIHFSCRLHVDELDQFEFNKLLQYDTASFVRAAQMVPELPILLAPCDRLTACYGYDYSDPLTQVYRSIFVDLVVESHVAGKTFFPTEKTIRPILMKKPFIVFGSRDYLLYLRQMGFRTFGDFWDESYDGYSNGDRLSKIYQVIDSLSAMTREQLESMYWDMKYSLDHNYELLMNKKFTRVITPL